MRSLGHGSDGTLFGCPCNKSPLLFIIGVSFYKLGGRHGCFRKSEVLVWDVLTIRALLVGVYNRALRIPLWSLFGGGLAVPGFPKVPKIIAQYPKIESIGSRGSIILGILAFQAAGCCNLRTERVDLRPIGPCWSG